MSSIEMAAKGDLEMASSSSEESLVSSGRINPAQAIEQHGVADGGTQHLLSDLGRFAGKVMAGRMFSVSVCAFPITLCCRQHFKSVARKVAEN